MPSESKKPADETIDPADSKRILSVLNALAAAADKAQASPETSSDAGASNS